MAGGLPGDLALNLAPQGLWVWQVGMGWGAGKSGSPRDLRNKDTRGDCGASCVEQTTI